ncbi:HAMP domain-containing sensor histidine kinase [Methanocalculus sp.]|uniref:sensor histidine kinase n=1 Tax=Methanocalculus sp. TaxID=2004547 RepID=UPI00272480C4|nr:sensor histidine kinase [Methanocalculus sp.]MDO8841399.1 sensor histidine kinase [Methanocalculus sp.]
MSQKKAPVGIIACQNLDEEVRAALRGSPYAEIPVIFYEPHCTHPYPEWQKRFLADYASLGAAAESVCLITCGCPYPVPDLHPALHLRSPDIFLTDPQFRLLLGEGVYIITSGFAKGYALFLNCQMSGEQELHHPLADVGITRVIHLRTRNRPDSDDGAKRFAEGLNAELRVVETDPGVFTLHLRGALRSLESEVLRRHQNARCGLLEEQVADYTMAFDLLGDIAAAETEDAVVNRLGDLFSLLFSPSVVMYSEVPFPEGTPGLLLPVRYGELVLGWFRIDGFEHPEFLNRYQNTAEFLLPVFGLAIRNARIYQRLLDANIEKDEEIAARREVQDALFLANKKLNLLTAITRHDILNDVSVAVGYLDLASDLVVSEEVKSTFSRLTERMDAIQRKLGFTRDYQDMGVHSPKWQMIRSSVDDISEAILKGSGITLENQLPEVEIYADPMLPKLVHNLTQNALFHAASATYLRWSAEPDGCDLIISVEDDGPGVPEKKKESIFRPAFGRSHGFGLYLVSEILSITDISISEAGTFGEGAMFLIRVPEGRWRRSPTSCLLS